MKTINLGNTLIIGDSYSTFSGYVPEGYDVWYNTAVHPDNGVLDVDKTWWRRLFCKVDGTVVLNDSWSGTTVCNTGYNGQDVSSRSFVARAKRLSDESFFERERIDTVLVFGGTNDSWANAPLGDDDDPDGDLYCVRPAIFHLQRLLSTVKTHPRVIFIINPIIKESIVSAFVAAAQAYGTEVCLIDAIDLFDGHPTDRGMSDIAEGLYAYLEK